MSVVNVQKIKCEVTFLRRSTEGWGRTTTPVLNGNWYRPHLVIGDPNQRQPILKTGTYEVENSDGSKSLHMSDKIIDEEYIGVSFDTGPDDFELGQLISVKLTLMYWPGPQYDDLQPGKTFTVREGGTIVGFGTIGPPRFEEPINRVPNPRHPN